MTHVHCMYWFMEEIENTYKYVYSKIQAFKS